MTSATTVAQTAAQRPRGVGRRLEANAGRDRSGRATPRPGRTRAAAPRELAAGPRSGGRPGHRAGRVRSGLGVDVSSAMVIAAPPVVARVSDVVGWGARRDEAVARRDTPGNDMLRTRGAGTPHSRATEIHSMTAIAVRRPIHLPRRSLGQSRPDVPGSSTTRPTRQRPPARRTTPPRRSTRRPSRPRSPRSRSRAKLPAYERGRILREISAGLKARREELGRTHRHSRPGKPIRDALIEVDRAVLTFRLGRRRRRSGWSARSSRSTSMPASKDRVGITAALPDRPDRRDQPVQLPAEPGRPQDRPGDRVAATRSCSSRRPRTRSTMLAVAEIIEAAGVPAGRGLDPADDPRARRPDGRRSAVQAADVHRLARRSAGG